MIVVPFQLREIESKVKTLKRSQKTNICSEENGPEIGMFYLILAILIFRVVINDYLRILRPAINSGVMEQCGTLTERSVLGTSA